MISLKSKLGFFTPRAHLHWTSGLSSTPQLPGVVAASVLDRAAPLLG